MTAVLVIINNEFFLRFNARRCIFGQVIVKIWFIDTLLDRLTIQDLVDELQPTMLNFEGKFNPDVSDQKRDQEVHALYRGKYLS